MSPRILTTAVLILILSSSPWAHAQQNDDVALLRQEVPPNVVLLLDTSGSMALGLNANEFTSVPNRDNWQFNDRFPLDLTTKVPVGQVAEDEQNSFYCDLPRPTRFNNTGASAWRASTEARTAAAFSSAPATAPRPTSSRAWTTGTTTTKGRALAVEHPSARR